MTERLSSLHTTAMASPGNRSSRSPSRLGLWSLAWYWGPIFFYMAVIFAVSSMTSLPDIPGGFSDKTVHFFEFAVLALLLARGLAGPRWLSITFPYIVAAILLAIAYGVSDEVHQWSVPNRHFDRWDMVADALGACTSTGVLWAWGIIRRKSDARKQPHAVRTRAAGE